MISILILISFTTQVFGQNTNQCGTVYGCFRFPATCTAASNCKAFTLYRYNSTSQEIEITLTRQGAGWVAFGLNSKPSEMDQTAGESCSYDGTNVLVKTFVAVKNNRPDFKTPPAEIKVLETKFGGGAVVCRYTRPVLPPANSSMRAASSKWFLTSAFGSVSNGILDYHGNGGYFSSKSTVNLTSATSVSGKTTIRKEVTAHGCLMVLAWTFFAICGIFTARFLKGGWPNSKLAGEKVWFQVHRGCMISAWLFTLISFILIFADVGELSGGDDEKNHAIIGIVVTILAFVQPIMAVFRPHPGESKRWIFNWAHWFVGTAALILGEVNIILGLGLVKVTRVVIIIHIVVSTVVFFLCDVIAWHHSKTSGEETVTQTTEMAQETTSAVKGFLRSIYGFFGFLILFAAVMALTMLGLIIKKASGD